MGRLAVGAGLAVGLIGMLAPAASAAPPKSLNAVGSDTTYWAMGVVSGSYNISPTQNPQNDVVVNTPPQVVPPFPTGMVVPADDDCGVQTYSAANVPPDGSGAGRAALFGTAGASGCVDFSRSSSRGSEANAEYYAYALDALDWVHFAGEKVTNLTPAQIKNIYTCNPATGAPYISNWNQIPGSTYNATIVKYAPQTQSGTYGFFKSKYLGNTDVDSGCDAAHKSTFLQEHKMVDINPATANRAIGVFAYGQFLGQQKGVIPDARNKAILGKVNGVVPSLSKVKEDGTGFFGVRYVYNVARTDGPTYADAIKFMGETGSGNGFICKGLASTTLKAFGLVPLALKLDPATGHNSYCRKNPTPI
jgi:phosphate transport system substrate-binding protein